MSHSLVESSDFICSTVEDFVSELKVVMQETICEAASCKASSSSENRKTMCIPVAKEMFNILSEIFKISQPEDTPMTERRTQDVSSEAQNETELDTAASTSEITVVVLDIMDGSSVGRDDLKISDLLIYAAEKIKNRLSVTSF